MSALPVGLMLAAAIAAGAPAPPPAPAAPPPAKAAFPTTAQCVALGAPRTPIAFGPGELLSYELDALGAKAGTMTLRVLPLRNGQIPVEAHAETNTFFSKVRRVIGTITSTLDPKTLRPVKYLEDAHENEFHRIAEVQFRKGQPAHLRSTINGRTSESELAWGNDLTDVAGAMYLLRQLDWAEGKRACVDVYGIRRIWRVWGRVLPREQVSLPVGEFNAWHLAGEAAPLDLPDARREMHVWISDDAQRLPLAALGAIDLGTVRATLVGVQRPDRSRQAENKGNLKW